MIVVTILSNKNRVLLQPIAPNRGLIYDRNARLLAENTASHSVTITKEHTPDIGKQLLLLAKSSRCQSVIVKK